MSTPLVAERVVTTLDAAETRSLAARLAAAARPGDLLCLIGELGAGKTQFAKGFAVGLGISDTVTSPTFVLMTEYAGRLPLFHLDLYRLDDAADALAGGLLDERQLEGVALVEWAERLGPALPSQKAGRPHRRHRRRAAADRPALARRGLHAVPRGRGMTVGGPLLLIDTATTRAVIALGSTDGRLIEERTWTAGYRHGEELLARIEALLRDRAIAPAALGGLVVGTGPGAFTGLRVGIATAKGLAHALRLPIAGVVTGSALLAAAGAGAAGPVVLLQPAGSSDRVVSRPGERPVILPGGTDPELRPGERLAAVDLAGRAPDDAVELGDAAHDGLATAMLAAGAARLAAGDADDLARLVPEYVTLPRGVRGAPGDDAVELSGGAA